MPGACLAKSVTLSLNVGRTSPLHSSHLNVEAENEPNLLFDYQVAAVLTFKGEIDVPQSG
jgi:hypothetical protein